MSSSWQSAYASLDDCLGRLSETMGRLKAAQPVDVAGVVDQVATAEVAAQSLRSFISMALPEASWRSREELDALLAQIPKLIAARSRLSALATELERGLVVHRRTSRADHLNQLREQALNELRTLAGAEEPLTLPGPEAEQWIEWACGLRDSEDAESLRILRDGFAQLDNFVANLEPGMWRVKTESPV
jgi:hypothetical protein